MKSIYTNRIMGYKVAVSNVEEAVNIVSESLEELKGKVICLTTTNVLLNARDDTSLDFALKNAAILLACDEPIAWIQRLRGFATAEAIKEKEFCSRLRTELNNTGRSDYVSFQDYSEFDETKADPEKLVILVNAPRTFGGKVCFLFGCIKDSFEWQKKAPDEKKDMLIYAHYYYPDVASTGQILTELAEGLNHSFHITVICTVPSYTGKIEKNDERWWQWFVRAAYHGDDSARCGMGIDYLKGYSFEQSDKKATLWFLQVRPGSKRYDEAQKYLRELWQKKPLSQAVIDAGGGDMDTDDMVILAARYESGIDGKPNYHLAENNYLQAAMFVYGIKQ